MRTEPWFTTASIKFLDKYLDEHTNLQVLEFGCGGSTIYFSNRCENVITIEHNPAYAVEVSSHIQKNNVEFIIHLGKETYDDYINIPYENIVDRFSNEMFDIISIDGRNRVNCFKKSERLLKYGGLMILDNSEREIYQEILDSYKNKEKFVFTQTMPDKYGFYYPNWTTTIWIK